MTILRPFRHFSEKSILPLEVCSDLLKTNVDPSNRVY
jgi:hypothetical protein